MTIRIYTQMNPRVEQALVALPDKLERIALSLEKLVDAVGSEPDPAIEDLTRQLHDSQTALAAAVAKAEGD